MRIKNEIASWDGKSSSDIGAVYSRHSDDDSFVSQLIACSRQVDLQKGATWLLKRHMDAGGRLEADEIAELFKLLPELVHWETRIHILQCISYMPIGEAEKELVEAFLRKCLSDTNKFVRAWAYSGFYVISLQYP